MSLYTITVTPIGVNQPSKVLHANGIVDRTKKTVAIASATVMTYGIVNYSVDEFNEDLLHISRAKDGVHVLDVSIEETPNMESGALVGA